MKKLTVKEKKFVAATIQGKSKKQAAIDAGYSTRGTDITIKQNAYAVAARPHVQKAIDEALLKLGASPEWAVTQLMKVAEQDKEIGAKRLASKDILELHGWNKAERPTVQLDINNAFFGGGRKQEGEVIDADEAGQSQTQS